MSRSLFVALIVIASAPSARITGLCYAGDAPPGHVLDGHGGPVSGPGPGGNCQQPDPPTALDSTGAYAFAGPTTTYTGVRTADNFAVTVAGNITSVSWWGFYGVDGVNPCASTPPTDNFTVRIYISNGGRPGSLLGTYVQGTNLVVSRDPLSVVGPLIEYVYTATLSGTLVNALTTNCYWIEITNNLNGCRWLWETGTGSGTYPTAAQDLDGGAGPTAPNGGPAWVSIDVIQFDMAFCINNPLASQIAPGPCGVPASSTTDECVTATVPMIASNNTPTAVEMRGNTNNATDPAMCASEMPGDNGASVGSTWLKFTAAAPSHQIQTCSQIGTDTILAVYSGVCGSLVQLACNDDACDLRSRVCVDGLTVGSTYFIQLRAAEEAARGVYLVTVGPCLDCQAHLPAGAYLIVESETALVDLFDDVHVAQAGSLSALTARVTWWNGVVEAPPGGPGGSFGDRPAVDSLTLRVFEQDPNTGLPEPLPFAIRSSSAADLTVTSVASANTFFNFNGAPGFQPGQDGELLDYAISVAPIPGFQAGQCYWYTLSSDIPSPNDANFRRLGGAEGVMTRGNNRSGADVDGDGLERAELFTGDWISCSDLVLGDPDQCEAVPPCPGPRADANCNGAVDLFDLDPFILALFDLPDYLATHCAGRLCTADTDCSGNVDFFDIDPFLECLFNTCPDCP